jgi:hypothetical protein
MAMLFEYKFRLPAWRKSAPRSLGILRGIKRQFLTDGLGPLGRPKMSGRNYRCVPRKNPPKNSTDIFRVQFYVYVQNILSN